ncbi:hybrid signal transduction histidine kinase A isoform X2 [Drosophila tropicalis]|uniref:hybrid signal transduction histidine kinase A isoform X2 n=1 Tax=Drosophila tropicalis TaxID=46794 RepID=UPI0035ABA3FA
MPNSLPIHPLLLILLLPGAAWSGSCREAQLCCNGRDSSCVVQKAPINAIIEDLSDKPCYCDHACLKLGDCCDDFKDHCGVLDCQVSDWGAWSECDKSCGTGMMTRTRQILQAAQNGGKHCPSLLQKRGCQGYRCHGHRDKKILREMALLLPAALSRNRHANDSSDIRRNLRTRYHDSYKHNRDHEYCVEFEVIKASKACHKLPPYNLMLEGDRITVRCDLEALIQDSTVSSTTSKSNVYATSTTMATTTTLPHKSPENSNEDENNNNNNNNNNNSDDEDNEELEEDDDEDDAQNMLDTGSNESYEYRHQRVLPVGSHQRQRSATSKRSAAAIPLTTTTATPPISYHCRGEGLSGRTTRWSALAAPSCRGKWLRLTVGPPKKCNHAQFIFV